MGWLIVGLLSLGAIGVQVLPAVAEAAETPSATEILAKVDANLVSDTRSNTVKMTQLKNGRPREFVMQVYSHGNTQSSIETLAPVRDKGTRYLRMADEMWTYSPVIEKTSKISGHMLRQGLQGTDVSYEDMMSSSKLKEQYTSKVVGTEEMAGRTCYKLELTAIDATVAYPKRISWVDAENFIPLRQEMYAMSGLLLKTWEMSDIQDFGGRMYPTKMVVSDKVQEGTSTTLELSNLQFGVAIDDSTFTTGWLERK